MFCVALWPAAGRVPRACVKYSVVKSLLIFEFLVSGVPVVGESDIAKLTINESDFDVAVPMYQER